jgi:16S rRNA (guanine(966)-N(2))-methyltransferase RsmD
VSDAGRVIAGRARGIRLLAPGPGTRPLADRVKQTLFAILEPELRGARVLDLYAGSGAAGIEALSRGASLAVFVERDAGAARVIAANLERTGLAAAGRIVRADVAGYLAGRAAADGPFDIVLLDPPYEDREGLERALASLGDVARAGAVLAPRATVVAKHFWRDRPPARVGLLASGRERRFGETALTFYRSSESEESER